MELITPFENPKRVFRSKRRLFETPSLVESSSPELDLFSDIKEHSEEETTGIMTETMEQYMSKTRGNYGSSGQEDANEHIEKVLEIIDLYHIPEVTQDQHYLTDIPEVILFYNGLDVPTRQILDSKCAIPTKTATDAKIAIQEMAEYSQKWHNGTSSKTKSTETSDGLAAIQSQLNNLGREIKKVNEKVYAAQVGCELCKGLHYTKDCPLKEEGNTLEEAYYTQFGAPYQHAGQYRVAGPGFYQRNNGNSTYPDRRQTLEESLGMAKKPNPMGKPETRSFWGGAGNSSIRDPNASVVPHRKMLAVEKIGKTGVQPNEMVAFRHTCDICNLEDMDATGVKFTWSNGRQGCDNVKKGLDRFLANADWCRQYPKKNMFRFESMWLRDENFHDVVRDAWTSGLSTGRQSDPCSIVEECVGPLESDIRQRDKGLQINLIHMSSIKWVVELPFNVHMLYSTREAQDVKILEAYDHTLPQKEKDPGSFTLPCFIHNVCFDKALVDLGASVSVMPFSTYTNLGLGILSHTRLTIELADRTIKQPRGIAENVLVRIGKFIFPIDFIILDIPEDDDVPLILGRPFLSTAHSKIDVYKRKITLRVGEEKLVFKSIKPATSIIRRVFMLKNLDSKTNLIGEDNESFDLIYGNYIQLNDLYTLLEPKTNQDVDFEPTIVNEPDNVKTSYKCCYKMKFSCMIGYTNVNADFIPSLSINLITKSFYYSIIKDKDGHEVKVQPEP
ncbi:putative reverse transcriptase domain-containing protein [Tanacetum coccineum]